MFWWKSFWRLDIVNPKNIRYYDRTDISRRIDPTKSKKSRKCMICHYWFCNHGFKFRDYACAGCHDLTTLSLHTCDIVIITDKNVDHSCIMHNIGKSKSFHLLENSVLEDRGYT